jgi:predicted NBD/HSP70 family sugar kinase
MAAAGPLLLRQLRTELDRRLAPLAPPPALAPAALGNAAGVLGAAAAALDMLGRDDVIRAWRALPIDGLVGGDPFDAG